MKDERFGAELAVADETGHFGQFEIKFVGNRFDCEEGKIVLLSGKSNGGGFHVDGVGSVGFCELLLLRGRGDFGIADEDGAR